MEEEEERRVVTIRGRTESKNGLRGKDANKRVNRKRT